MSRYGNLISSGIYQSCLTSLKLTKKWSGTIMKAIRVIESEKYKKLVAGYLDRCSHPKDSTDKKTEVCPY